MAEILTLLFQAVIMVAIAAAGIAIRTYVIPWLKQKMVEKDIQISQAEWDLAQNIIVTLVTSAFRLKSNGQITDAKEYVMTLAKEQLEDIGITLSDEMIDEIRRAAVLEWEASVQQAEKELVTGEVLDLNEGELAAKEVQD